jgi:hypothetical protein
MRVGARFGASAWRALKLGGAGRRRSCRQWLRWSAIVDAPLPVLRGGSIPSCACGMTSGANDAAHVVSAYPSLLVAHVMRSGQDVAEVGRERWAGCFGQGLLSPLPAALAVCRGSHSCSHCV